MQERIQKILSVQGICSRRKAEEYIHAGFVKVNGKVACIGQKADAEVDSIEVDGKVVEARKEMLYCVMYKPTGVVTSNITQDPENKATQMIKTVRDLLPQHLRGKVFPVGRLDKDSEGLLLFTNDGVLAYRLTHPKFDHEKEYKVETVMPITNGQLKKLQGGLKIFGEKTKPARVQRMGDCCFHIVITEGRNRQIRRMCQKVGCPVSSLERVRIVTLRDPGLKSGHVRVLTAEEKEGILRAVGL